MLDFVDEIKLALLEYLQLKGILHDLNRKRSLWPDRARNHLPRIALLVCAGFGIGRLRHRRLATALERIFSVAVGEGHARYRIGPVCHPAHGAWIAALARRIHARREPHRIWRYGDSPSLGRKQGARLRHAWSDGAGHCRNGRVSHRRRPLKLQTEISKRRPPCEPLSFEYTRCARERRSISTLLRFIRATSIISDCSVSRLTAYGQKKTMSRTGSLCWFPMQRATIPA